MSTNKRPLRWRMDDTFGTRPLFDLLLGGPRHNSIWEWLRGIRIHLTALLRPSGLAYLRWHWMHTRNSGDRSERDRAYRRFTVLQRLERRQREE